MGMASNQAQNAGKTELIEQALVERIGKGEIDLPLLPQVAGQVMALTSDPLVDAARLSSLIHQDQALAAHVLRIANSPAYMPRTPIVSLQHAVAMLGIGLLSEIAFTVSLQKGAIRVPGFDADITQLWRHAMASGAYAKEIARIRKLNVENAYLCGLLHAIGKPVVLKTVLGIATSLHTPIDRRTVLSFIDTHHAPVGAMVAETWALPKQVAHAITYCHCYEQAPAFKQEVMITCLADRLATFLLAPDTFDEATFRAHTVFADLNLYPHDIEKLLGLKDHILAVVQAITL
jgi:putative nucleotidyltransferase with HDIG domain